MSPSKIPAFLMENCDLVGDLRPDIYWEVGWVWFVGVRGPNRDVNDL